MPASVIWGLLAALTVWYAKPDRALLIPLGVFCLSVFTQILGDITPLTWGAIDLLALTGAFYLHEKGNKAGFTIAVILILRLFWHRWHYINPEAMSVLLWGENRYILIANLLYGAILGAIAWNTYYSRR